jgi:hypothetical protein
MQVEATKYRLTKVAACAPKLGSREAALKTGIDVRKPLFIMINKGLARR